MRDPRKAFDDKLVALGKQYENLYAVSCDSASGGGLSGYFKQFPERSIEFGISEQAAVSACAGLAKQGLIPVLVIINPFLTMRAFEQIRDDTGYTNVNVKMVGSGGGLAYSTLGSTHIAIEDVALLRTIPNLVILSPGDAGEVEAALEMAVSIDAPVYIRMPRQAQPEYKEIGQRGLEFAKGEVITEGNDVAIFSYGPSTPEVVKATQILKEKGISATAVNFLTVKPLDEDAIKANIAGKKAVFTVEEHIETGGLGSAVAEIMAENAVGIKLCRLAIPLGSKQTGPYSELVEYYGISASKIAQKVIETLN